VARLVAFANQKGGVAKTTTTLSIAAALSRRGRRVLGVDLDPQGALTYSVGADPIEKVILTRPEGDSSIDIVPANIDLAGAEAVLLAKTGREYALERAFREITGRYDFILIDCPPSLGILTINGLTAAQEVVIPLQCEALSHRGVGQLLETLGDIRHFTNPHLQITGMVATMFDGRSRHAREVLADVGSRYGVKVMQPPVRKSIRFAEAAQAGQSILSYAPSHPGADAYRELGRQIDEGVDA
jgi:chromosome partitioning protein